MIYEWKVKLLFVNYLDINYIIDVDSRARVFNDFRLLPIE